LDSRRGKRSLAELNKHCLDAEAEERN